MRMLFEHEAERPSAQHHPRDPASVNTMKQTCGIIFLHILPHSSPIRTKNAAKTLNCPFLHWISLNKMLSAVYFLTS